MSQNQVKAKETEPAPCASGVPLDVSHEYELGEWSASAVQEPERVRSKTRLIAVLLGLNLAMFTSALDQTIVVS
jgi:hypothetical protein